MAFNTFVPLVFLPFIQGVTYCGESSASSLTMANVPWHEEVIYFVQQLANLLPNYEIACEHEHSNCLLLAHHKVTLHKHTWRKAAVLSQKPCSYCNFSLRPLKGVKNNDATAISVNVIEKKVFIWALALNGHSGEGLNLPFLCFYAVSWHSASQSCSRSCFTFVSCDSFSNGLRGQWALTSALLSQTKNIFMCKCYMVLQYPFMICYLYSEIKCHTFLHVIIWWIFLCSHTQ